jgi:hypothetical protein
MICKSKTCKDKIKDCTKCENNMIKDCKKVILNVCKDDKQTEKLL